MLAVIDANYEKSRSVLQSIQCNWRLIDLDQCDEVHPKCGNCEKHGVECDFATQRTPSESSLVRRDSASSASSSLMRVNGSSTSDSPLTALSPPPRIDPGVMSSYQGSTRMLELRLLHNYTALTANTLASNDTFEMRQAWNISVPNMAFESPCLLDAVFAVSALHMRTLLPNDKSLIRASHGYMASAISQYSSALTSGVNSSNAEALFTTSAIVAFQSAAQRRFPEEVYGTNNEYQLPVSWFHSFQGVKAVVLASWKYIRNSDRVHPIITAQPALSLDLKPARPTFFKPLLLELDEQLESLEPSKRQDTRQAYEHAVAFLNWSHQKPERARILGFPATVSRRFVELIEEHDPRALVIIACFFAMTAVVDNIWWLEGIAKRECEGILSLLPRSWWAKMEWPLRIASHKGHMDEKTWGDCWHTEGPPDNGFHGDVSIYFQTLAINSFLRLTAPRFTITSICWWT